VQLLEAARNFKKLTGCYPATSKGRGGAAWRPEHTELAKICGLASPNTYITRFGRLGSAWEKVEGGFETPEKVINKFKKGFPRIHTTGSILFSLLQFNLLVGTYPKTKTARDIWRPDHQRLVFKLGIPSPSTIRQRFGSLTKAWEAADRYAAELAAADQKVEA
jgi:hypothetical protein